MPKETRTPRPKPSPYTNRKSRTPKQHKPQTAAVPLDPPRKQHLTLNDKLQILVFIEQNPTLTQRRVVDYFATRPTGVLCLTQSQVSRIIRDQEKLKERANQNPTALSSKKARVVTRPDVDRALYLWVKHLNDEKGETASGPMLEAKRHTFEIAFNVPEEERL
ncbi:hypothetical protein F5050DRAFT_1554194, partial [Lentinula boryana]